MTSAHIILEAPSIKLQHEKYTLSVVNLINVDGVYMMKENIKKLDLMLEVSEEILANLENEDIPFEKILAKCKKLARLRNDYQALNWFTLELHGYNEKDIPEGIKQAELYECARQAGRATLVNNSITKKDEPRYWIESVPEIEADIQTNIIALENLKPPSQFIPAVSKSSYHSIYTGQTSSEHVIEKYQDVLSAVQVQRNNLQTNVKHNRTLLSKVRNSVYNHVLNINLQLKFESITESIFQSTKELVDKKLAIICPEAMKKFLAAYDRLKSSNPEEWSQALSSCRNILKEFADYVYPAQNDVANMADGTTLIVTADKYKNRLLAFIDKNASGHKRRLLIARSADLASRVHCLNDMLSQGTHEGLEITDVNICVIDTYLLIGSLISIVQLPGSGDLGEPSINKKRK